MSHLAYGAAESQDVLRTSLTHLCGPWCPRSVAQWPCITEGAKEWGSLSSVILSAPVWLSGGGEAEGALERGEPRSSRRGNIRKPREGWMRSRGSRVAPVGQGMAQGMYH